MINLTNNQVKALNNFTDFQILSLRINEMKIYVKINPFDNVILIMTYSKYQYRRYYIRKNRISCISIRNKGIKKKNYTYKLKKR